MLNNYKGNSAHLKALKLARREQFITEALGFLTLAAGSLIVITLVNWSIIGVFSAYQ
jgi:hypothetical protein